MATSRRNLLTGGLAAAALLAAGGVGLALRPGAPPPQPAILLALTPQQYGILVAVAARICPGGDGTPTATEIGVAGKVDALLSTMHPADAAELGQGLLLIENALVGLLLDGRVTPFTLLGPAEQDEVLDTFRTSRIPIRRSVFKALRGLIAASYWGDPRMYATAGYPGPPDYASLMQARDAEAEAGAPADAPPEGTAPEGTAPVHDGVPG
jgi:hypothetical protein